MRYWTSAAIITVVTVLFSVAFADHEIVNMVFSKSIFMFEVRVLGGPPRLTLLLLVAVALLSTTLFISGSVKLRMLRLSHCSISIAAAYLLASVILKPLFGRTGPMLWYSRQLDEFRWLSPMRGEYFFPSGHAAMLMAWAIAMSFYWPLKRREIIVTGIGACLMLVALNLHYLSDVIAGGFIGASVALGILWLAPVSHPENP